MMTDPARLPTIHPRQIPADPAIVRHLNEVPPVTQPASIHDIEFPDGIERWWKPTWVQRLRYVRWLWLTVPILLILLTVQSYHFAPGAVLFVLQLQPGLVVMIIVLPVMLAIWGSFNAIHRKGAFCIHCGYDLTALPDRHCCPECGMKYTLAAIDDYRRDPAWFIKRWRQRHQHPPGDVPFHTGPPTRRQHSRDGT